MMLMTGLVTVMNAWWLRVPFIGVVSVTAWFGVGAFVLSRIQPVRYSGERLLNGLILAIGLILVGLIAFYFWRFPSSLMLGVLGIMTIWLAWLGWQKPKQPAVAEPPDRSFSLVAFSTSAVFLTFVAGMVMVWWMHRAHVYFGNAPIPLPPLVISLIFFGLFILAQSRLPRPVWLLILIFTVVGLNSHFLFFNDTLYGADSWRHYGKIVRVETGAPYPPTNPAELIRLQTEKVPNGSLYTTVPLMSYLTTLSSFTLMRYAGLLLFIPLMVAVLYYAALDLSRSEVIARIISLTAVFAPGYLSLEGFLNVRTIGLTLFVVNAWVWGRYLFERDRSLRWSIVPVTLVAILAYPTTGYYSALVAGLVLLVRILGHRFQRGAWRWLLLPAIVVAAAPIFMLDASRNVIRDGFRENWWTVLDAVMSWLRFHFDAERLFSFLGALGILFALVLLVRSKQRRVLIVLAVLLGALIVNSMSLTLFPESYAPFTSRTPMLLNLFYAVVIGASLGWLIIHVRALRSISVQLGLAFFFALAVTTVVGGVTVTFGWTPSEREVEAVRAIESLESNPYVVLTDETTSAVGYALSDNETSYSWYPNTPLWGIASAFIVEPTEKKLQDACALSQGTAVVYYLATPIPPSEYYREKNRPTFEELMDVVYQNDQDTVYRYPCPASAIGS